MLKTLLEKDKYYWIFFLITVMLCFGFLLTNSSMGIDDEILDTYNKFTGWLFNNRLGRCLTTRVLSTCEYLPFWRDFISVILYVIGITLHVNNFTKYLPEIFDKKSAIVFSCLAVSFPYIAFNSIFIVTCIEQGLILVLSAAAVYYFNEYFLCNKKIKNLLFVMLSLILAISLYETGVLYFLTAAFSILFCKLIYKKSFRGGIESPALKYLISAFSLSIISYIINIALVLLAQSFLHIRYLHINDVFRYDLSSFINLFKSIYFSLYNFIKIFSATLSSDFGSVMIVIVIFVLLVIVLFYSMYLKNIYVLISGILVMTVPFSAFLMTGNYELPYRVYTAFCITEGAAFMLIYNLCKHNEKLIKIFLVIVSIIVLHQTKEFNQILYTEHLKFQHDVEFTRQVMYDLSKLNLEEKPLIFVGTVDNPELRHSYYTEAAEVNISIFNWDRYDTMYGEIFVRRGIHFMRELGYNARGYWDISEDILRNTDSFIELIKENTKQMNIYPKENSIKDLGDFVLIKIGNSKMDK